MIYPFHQNILLRPHFPNYCIIFCAIRIKELRNAILWFSTYVHDLTLSQKFASKLFSQFWQKNIKGNCGRKCTEEKTNKARITNSTRIEGCSKILLLSQLSQKHVFLKIACRNLKKSAKITKVTRNFIATIKTPL